MNIENEIKIINRKLENLVVVVEGGGLSEKIRSVNYEMGIPKMLNEHVMQLNNLDKNLDKNNKMIDDHSMKIENIERGNSSTSGAVMKIEEKVDLTDRTLKDHHKKLEQLKISVASLYTNLSKGGGKRKKTGKKRRRTRR